MKTGHFKKNFYVTCITPFLIFPILLMCMCSPGLQAGMEDVITRSFNVSEDGLLTMDVSRGSIVIETGRDNVVKVKVIRKVRTSNEQKAQRVFEKYRIDFFHSDSDVTIKTDDRVGRSGFFSWLKGVNFKVRYIVTVPGKYNLDLRTSGGSISVNDITGDVKVKTSGGSLSLSYIKGPVWGKTSGGSITLEGCSGKADVYTSGGSIRVGTVKGIVKAHTSGGSIRVKEVAGTINAHTSGGSVSAYISKQPEGDCSLSTSGGSITVHLEDDIEMDVNARTSGGKVYTDFPVTMTIRGEVSKRRLKGKINGGGPELYLRTSGGSIRIKKL